LLRDAEGVGAQVGGTRDKIHCIHVVFVKRHGFDFLDPLEEVRGTRDATVSRADE
jgi:hypothetical protein